MLSSCDLLILQYGFLDDQQVDEFKGMAMLFILCYNYMAPVIQQVTHPPHCTLVTYACVLSSCSRYFHTPSITYPLHCICLLILMVYL